MSANLHSYLRRPQAWLIVAGLIITLILPLLVGSYWLHVIIIGYFYAILASSWSLLAGYGGQFSFGHMAFMALGGYVSGLVSNPIELTIQIGSWAPPPIHLDLPIIVGIVAGTLVAGLAGWAIGVLTLRFRAAYLALFTIAFSEILRTIIRAEPQITRGDRGLRVEPLFNSLDRIPEYYVMLGVMVVSLIIMYWIAQSRIGLFLRAIREDEEAAAARGVDVVRYKVLMFVITSLFAGLAGTIFVHYVTIITPNVLVISQMGLVIAMAIIGGVESLIAAALGAILMQIGLEVLREFGAWRMVIFGAALVLTLRFARNGLVAPVFQRLFALGPRAEQRESLDGSASP